MTARDIMATDVVTIRETGKACEAADLLIRSGQEALPVVDEGGRVVGFISDRDLMRLALPEFLDEVDLSFLPSSAEFFAPEEGCPVGDVPVASFMRRDDLLEVAPKEPVAEVARIMLTEGAPRVAVVDDDKLVGMIARRDVLRAIMDPLLGSSPE